MRVTVLIALALGLAPASPAQDAPEGSGNSEPVFYHGVPDCDYRDRFCVWGQLFNAVVPNKERPKPLKKGPIDVCYQWDSTCSAPYQTVCKLHGPHGFQGREGSYFFALPTSVAFEVIENKGLKNWAGAFSVMSFGKCFVFNELAFSPKAKRSEKCVGF